MGAETRQGQGSRQGGSGVDTGHGRGSRDDDGSQGNGRARQEHWACRRLTAGKAQGSVVGME